MDVITFEISKTDHGKSILDWLKGFSLSRKTIIELEKNHAVLINGSCLRWNNVLKIGDVITIDISKFENNNYLPFKQHIDILYEDEDVLVVNKPSKILVHPDGVSNETLGNMISFYYFKCGLDRSVRHIHRLDYDTSGCIIYAKHVLAQSFLENQLDKRLIDRIYTAICYGRILPNQGTIDKNIGRNRHVAGKYIVSKTGKEAITHYRVIKSNDRFSLVELKLDTGRTHQIRVHLNSMNHPIVGDKLYAQNDNHRLMLHASRVEFTHPRSKRKIKVAAPLPKEFKSLW